METLAPLSDSLALDRQAYEKIKEAILSFHFLPNQALVESELAIQLGISKTPVRDALKQLEKEGLVNRVPYKGTLVSDINSQDMANLYQIRIILEGLAIRLAAKALTEDDFNKMEALITEHNEKLKCRAVDRVSKINSEFHSLIINRCSNPRLQQMLNNLDDSLRRYRLLSILQKLRMEKSVPEHRLIFQALRDGDPEKAEHAMQLHLQSAMSDLYNQDFEQLLKDFNLTE